MENTNKKLFALDEVYSNIPYGRTLSMLLGLKEIRETLVEIKDGLLAETFAFGQNVDEVAMIDEQLIYLNKNIKTFEEALMCHETKVIEKRTMFGGLGVFYLN